MRLFHSLNKGFVMALGFLIFLGLPIVSAQSLPVTDGLVSYWTFDTGTYNTTTVFDIMGNNDCIRGGVIDAEYNPVPSDIGYINQSFNFTGAERSGGVLSNSTYINCGYIPLNNFTVESWIYDQCNYTVQSRASTIFTNFNDTYLWDAGFTLQIYQTATTGTRSIEVYAYNFTDGGTYISYPIETAPNGCQEWKHIAVTRADNIIRLYYNGIEVDNSTDVSLGTLGDGSNSETFIGAFRGEDYAEPYYYKFPYEGFNGSLEEIKLYNRSLNSSEIMQNYLATSNDIFPPITPPEEEENVTEICNPDLISLCEPFDQWTNAYCLDNNTLRKEKNCTISYTENETIYNCNWEKHEDINCDNGCYDGLTAIGSGCAPTNLEILGITGVFFIIFVILSTFVMGHKRRRR